MAGSTTSFVHAMSAAVISAALLVPALASAGDVIKDGTYDKPLNSTAGVDAAMAKMETRVQPDVLEAFKKAHPAPFWLFGEDRQLAVRNNIIPAHWFEGAAAQCGKFAGTARPGEFYVFQVCMIAGEKPVASVVPQFSIAGLPGAQVQPISRPSTVRPGEVKPFWLGIQIPTDAQKGEYHGTATVAEAVMDVTLKVDAEPISDSGTGDAWRLARLKWLDSGIGESDTQVTRPFVPIRVDEEARTLDILGRRVTLAQSGIPSQFTSFFSGSNTKILDRGRNACSAPPRLECIIGGKAVNWSPERFKFTRQSPVGVEWEAISRAHALSLAVRGRLEFDGSLRLEMNCGSLGKSVQADDVRFVVPWAADVVRYAMGMGLQGGKCPPEYHWKWNVAKNQDAVWMGDVNIGSMLRFKGANYRRPLINAYYDFQPLNLPESWGGGGVDIETADGRTTLVAHSGPILLEAADGRAPGPQAFDVDWYFTPFKPLDTARHFADRYYHAHQGAAVEDFASLRKAGANIIEVHHNRLCNPYINYPYNDDSIGPLTDFVARAHAAEMRVNVYYTTRELTQNLPEFFALKSLDGEVILNRREGASWPVTNPNGPHPWLKQHAGTDIVPAWRENLHYPGYKSSLDLAVITTPDSRWNNFYLEGLNYLIRKAAIDGLYIDDTALDRRSMQRARRILDADGNTGRRVNMHSWNHFNALARWANSSIAFMELYPYYDGLWHGESFNANAPPDTMLVEMSGIPYGLMSEMLDHPNPWHGMVFGMTTRWPWSGDPRNLWKAEDEFGITEAEFIGWWDAACPVRADNPDVKVSIYHRGGKTLIALASWAQDRTTLRLAVDWRAVDLDAAKARLWAPAIPGFQPELAVSPDSPITVEPGKGWLFIIDEDLRRSLP